MGTVLFDNLLFVCLAALILSHIVGINGVWAAFPVGEVCTLIALVVMASVYHKRPVKGFEALLQLPDDDEICEYVFQCETLDEFLDKSTKAAEFACRKGADKKTALKISLCIEECGKNVMEWAFKEDEQPLLSVRLFRDI